MNGSSQRDDDSIARLTAAVEGLSDQVRLLLQVTDYLLSEIQWHNNQDTGRSGPSPFVLTSMPLDPATADWQINRAPQPASSPLSAAPSATRARTLFE